MWTFICIYILHYYYLWDDVKISLWTYYYTLSVINSVLFGKYRNRTEFTDTEFSRYQVFLGTDRYQFLRNRICNSTEEPNRSVRYLPNAQGAVRLEHLHLHLLDGVLNPLFCNGCKCSANPVFEKTKFDQTLICSLLILIPRWSSMVVVHTYFWNNTVDFGFSIFSPII